MEGKQKRSTVDINRKNFENARRILFGTSRIPGTSRERWTTAGVIDPKLTRNDASFQLGPYTYSTSTRQNGQSCDVYIGDAGHVTIFPKHLLLRIISSIENNYIEGHGLTNINKYDTRWFRQNDKLYYTATLAQYVNSSLGGLRVPHIEHIAPSDHTQLVELYRKSKYSGIDGDSLHLSWDGGATICNIPIKDGVFPIDDKTAVVVAIGFPGIIVHVTTVAPTLGPYCTSYGEKYHTFTTLDELRTFLDGVRWLMHVLTGPDPRLGKDIGDSPTKESSEPKPLETWFTIAPDGPNWYKFEQKKQYTFFIDKDIKTAILIRDSVLYYLHNIPNSSFVSNYTVYINNPGSSITRGAEYPAIDFLNALKRIREYTEYEFLGCAMCTVDADLKCGGSCQKRYCNVECQQLDHLEGMCI